MNPIFEAKYIAIKWHDKDTVLKIKEALLPISIDIEDEANYKLELQAYTRIENGLDGQIAFHISKENNDIEPYYLNADNSQSLLLKIIDPATHKVWWIENGNWKKIKTGGYRESPLWNHGGDTKVIFGNKACKINVRANSFTRQQLDLYLNDFKNDFWYLILKKDSITQGEAKEREVKLLNKNTMNLINRFIEFIEKVLTSPKKELREIQGVKDIKKVKPVPRTFMEIATIGFQKKLTSRDTIESYNVAENKFIYYILDKVYNIVFYMLRASGHIDEILKRKLQLDEKRIQGFTNTKTIDKETFENEIEDLKNKIKMEKENLSKSILEQDPLIKETLEKEIIKQKSIYEQIAYAIQNQPQVNNQNQPQKFVIKLENKQQNYANKIQFWGKIKKIESETWDSFEQNNWLSLEFNDIFNFIQPNSEFEIFAKNIYQNHQTQKGTIHKIYFSNIIELKPINLQQNLEQELEYKTLYIKLNSRQDDHHSKIQYWGKEKNNHFDKWIELNKHDSLSLEFDKNLFENTLSEYQEYKITGYISESIFEKKKGGIIYKRYFQFIEDIEQITPSLFQQALNSLESQRPSLENSNWIRPLNSKEIHEQLKEKKALEEATYILKSTQKDNSELITNLKPAIKKLKKLLNKCKDLKIQKDSYFPNSMTFIQNPNYQGSYSFYKKINEIVGVDEKLFVQIQLLEKIGLLDIPTIYERWCYLQIIKVLIDKYRFQPEDNWKTKLANQMMSNLNNIKDIKINFTNTFIEREIDLWYEKVLDSGKRPDFILDIKPIAGAQYTHKIIMDAKFHEEVDVKEQIEFLYKKKNYSEDYKNTVFILHPDRNKSIKKRRNPVEWGNDAYYGEVEMFNFDWDKDDNPIHKYGAVLLSPIENNNYIDNLQRLIGMNMQYNFEDNIGIKLGDIELGKDILNPYPKVKQFCMQCGSHKINTVYEGYSKSKKGKFYQMACEECSHSFIYFYCWNCNQRLIKNGSYWSYHAFHVLEPFDIKCPNCEKYWVNNKDSTENIKIQQLIIRDTHSNNEGKVFVNYNDGIAYIKNNPGISLVRNPNGDGWITK